MPINVMVEPFVVSSNFCLNIEMLLKNQEIKINKLYFESEEYKMINENTRIGEINYNSQGYKMTIIDYKKFDDITVQFEDGYIAKHHQYGNFKRGTIRNPYSKSIYGVGYLGEGEYITKINGKHTRTYETWRDMLKRCYCKSTLIKHPTYENCSVSEEWHNFQNFAKWYDENYYEIEGQRMELDKDILHKGNKMYSSENCVFVPSEINSIFTKNNIKRGIYPIGVHWAKDRQKFIAQCCNNTYKQEYLGAFDTVEEAFEKYKNFKEGFIKQIANKYKDLIPKRLYLAMIGYLVEITD